MIQLLLTLLIPHFLSSIATAQQNYSGNSVLHCNNNDANGPSPAFLYTCNGLHKSCQSFLIFESQPPYNTILTISNLTSSNPEELASINNVTVHSVFPTGKEVIVPVTCSCKLRDYYEAETKYILDDNDTYFTVAKDTYQSLSTCDALKRTNSYGELDLFSGLELHVPLRCACPTQHQIANGTRYLLTYPANLGDYIYNIAARFNLNASSILDANGITAQEEALFPSTTILIPLPSEPSSSSTIVRHDQPADYVPPTASIIKKIKSKRKLYVAVAAATVGFLLVLFVILSAMFLFRTRLARFFKRGRKGKTKWVSSEDIREKIASIEYVSKVYSFEEIMEATENFNSRNRIKGSVFRGVFGRDIFAVKKMRADASKEVNMLKKINHFNLIKLQGYCNHNGFFYLVFEYMENGSLREWLSRNGSPEHQSWEKRIQIALDIANGLQYLHNFIEPRYVHKDINSHNILLNSDLRAKIANFTLAKEAENEVFSGSPTSHVVGTRGYMAPEYLEAGIVTAKMDVYAFGVVLLELITGKDSITAQEGREIKLSAAIVSLIGKENAEAKLSLFIDPSLTGNGGKEFAMELAKLSLACLLRERARRPNMAEIVSSLLKIHVNMHKGIPPSVDDR